MHCLCSLDTSQVSTHSICNSASAASLQCSSGCVCDASPLWQGAQVASSMCFNVSCYPCGVSVCSMFLEMPGVRRCCQAGLLSGDLQPKCLPTPSSLQTLALRLSVYSKPQMATWTVSICTPASGWLRRSEFVVPRTYFENFPGDLLPSKQRTAVDPILQVVCV